MRSRWSVAVAAVLVAATGAGALDSRADDAPRGSVSGRVRSDAGVDLPDVTVRLQEDDAPASLGGVTDSTGRYAIGDVPYGTYRFTANASSGFAPFTIDALTVGGDIAQDVTLRRNYADTRAGAAIATDAPADAGGCPATRLADSDQDTAVRTASPTLDAGDPQPRSFTVTLSKPLADPEVRIDPAPACGAAEGSGLYRYDLLASSDGSTFSTVASGTFDPSDMGRLTRVALAEAPSPVRAIRLVARDTFAAQGGSDSGYLSIAELEVLARTPTPAPTPTTTPVPTPTPRVRYGVGMDARIRPRRDIRPPFKFIATGKLFLPAYVPPERGCTGKVRITAMRDKRFAGGRLAGVAGDCTFMHDVPLKRKVLGRRGTVKFVLRFQGSLELKPKFITRTAAYGPVHPPKRRKRR